MSGLTLWPVQQAIYSKLNADATLGAMIEGVFDRVREGTDYPYVVLAGASSEDEATQTTAIQRIRAEIEIYSREGGRKQALQIADRIAELLHEGSLSISGQTLLEMRVSEASSEQLADGLTYRGRLSVQLWVQ